MKTSDSDSETLLVQVFVPVKAAGNTMALSLIAAGITFQLDDIHTRNHIGLKKK